MSSSWATHISTATPMMPSKGPSTTATTVQSTVEGSEPSDAIAVMMVVVVMVMLVMMSEVVVVIAHVASAAATVTQWVTWASMMAATRTAGSPAYGTSLGTDTVLPMKIIKSVCVCVCVCSRLLKHHRHTRGEGPRLSLFGVKKLSPWLER